jgi:hypothetical protein
LVLAATHLSHGLTSLNVDLLSVHDSFLVALSNSPAAMTLKTFSASRSSLTDHSCDAWSSFSSLEKITLSYSDLIGEKTLLALARTVPSIRSIQCFTDQKFKPEILESILAPPSMPLMSHLKIHVRIDDGTHEAVLAALQSRPNLHLIQEISIGYSRYGSFAMFNRIHTLCPNLNGPQFRGLATVNLLAPENASLLPNLSNFIGIATLSFFPAGNVPLPTIAAIFPRLEWLTISDQASTDLSMFSCLKSLIYSYREFVHIEKWPSTLKSLDLSFSGETSPDALDSFYTNMAKSLTALKILVLNVPPEMIQMRHVKLLLESCPALKLCSAPNGEAEMELSWKICHPTLRFPPDGFGARSIGYLPGMESAYIDSDYAIWNKLYHRNLPNFNTLTWDTRDEPVQNSPATFIGNVASKNRRFADLCILFAFDAELVQQIPSMSHIHSLSLRSRLISWQQAQTLLERLTWLVSFGLQVSASPETNFSWLTHPRLVNLTLVVSGALAADASGLKVGRTTLPSLRKIDLSIETVLHYIPFAFADLESLREVRISEAQLCALEFDGCPCLSKLDLNAMRLDRLKLTQTQFLQHINFHDVAIVGPLDDGLLPTALPRLKEFICVAEETPDSSLSEFVQKIECAVPTDQRPWVSWTTDI